MTLETIEGVTGPQPVATIIVLHGLGADGNDFVPVAQQLDLRPVGPVRYVFPHAPIRPVTLNGGARMRAWYDLASLDLLQKEDEAGLRASRIEVQALVDREVARGVAAERIVLMGFSQGCAMTLLTGLRAPNRLAGLVGLSGYLPLAASTAAERSEANQHTPIFMGHGRNDPLVPHAAGTASRDALRKLGHEVEWHDYPMEHSVCDDEIVDLNRWLVKVLKPVA